jgi:hypothetical protein
MEKIVIDLLWYLIAFYFVDIMPELPIMVCRLHSSLSLFIIGHNLASAILKSSPICLYQMRHQTP